MVRLKGTLWVTSYYQRVISSSVSFLELRVNISSLCMSSAIAVKRAWLQRAIWGECVRSAKEKWPVTCDFVDVLKHGGNEEMKAAEAILKRWSTHTHNKVMKFGILACVEISPAARHFLMQAGMAIRAHVGLLVFCVYVCTWVNMMIIIGCVEGCGGVCVLVEVLVCLFRWMCFWLVGGEGVWVWEYVCLYVYKFVCWLFVEKVSTNLEILLIGFPSVTYYTGTLALMCLKTMARLDLTRSGTWLHSTDLPLN